jgi:hypothetical protein
MRARTRVAATDAGRHGGAHKAATQLGRTKDNGGCHKCSRLGNGFLAPRPHCRRVKIIAVFDHVKRLQPT